MELDWVYEVPGNGSWLKVPLGKLDPERVAPLDDSTLKIIDRISCNRSTGPRPPFENRSADFLFTHHGYRLSPTSVRSEVCRAADPAGLGKLTPLRLRHTYAPALVNAGVPSLRYGQLFYSTIRTVYDRALDLAKIRIGPMSTTGNGGRTTLPMANIIHGDWREASIIEARMTGSYCLRAPTQKPYPYADIYAAPSQCTDDTHNPVLAAQRRDAEILIRDAQARGWTSEADRHRQLIASLDTFISPANTG